MKVILVCLLNVCYGYASPSIRESVLINKISEIKPVGGPASLLPLPTPTSPTIRIIHREPNGRRHLEEDCSPKPGWKEENEGPGVDIFGEYYDEGWAKTMATVVFPAHIDRKHFEVTTQDPYLTVGTIDGIGHHPVTLKSEHPSECEKIYQDHMGALYSDEESAQMSEESLEFARLPFDSVEVMHADMYGE